MAPRTACGSVRTDISCASESKAVANCRTVSPQLFNKLNYFCGFLLRQLCEFESYLASNFREPVGVSLSDEDEHRHHERSCHGGCEFKPREWRWIYGFRSKQMHC